MGEADSAVKFSAAAVVTCDTFQSYKE